MTEQTGPAPLGAEDIQITFGDLAPAGEGITQAREAVRIEQGGQGMETIGSGVGDLWRLVNDLKRGLIQYRGQAIESIFSQGRLSNFRDPSQTLGAIQGLRQLLIGNIQNPDHSQESAILVVGGQGERLNSILSCIDRELQTAGGSQVKAGIVVLTGAIAQRVSGRDQATAREVVDYLRRNNGYNDASNNDIWDTLSQALKSSGNSPTKEAIRVVIAERQLMTGMERLGTILSSPEAYYQWRALGCIADSDELSSSPERLARVREISGVNLTDDETLIYFRRQRLQQIRAEVDRGDFGRHNDEKATVITSEQNLAQITEATLVNFFGYSRTLHAIRRFGLSNSDTPDRLRTYFSPSRLHRETERGQRLLFFNGEIQGRRRIYVESNNRRGLLPIELDLLVNEELDGANRTVADFCGQSLTERCKTIVRAECPTIQNDLQRRQERRPLTDQERLEAMGEVYQSHIRSTLQSALNTYFDRCFWTQGSLPERSKDEWEHKIDDTHEGVGELIWIAGGKVYQDYVRACHRLASFYFGEFSDYISSDVKGKVSGWVNTNYPPDAHMSMAMSDPLTAKAMQILDCQAQMRVRHIQECAKGAGITTGVKEKARIRYEHKLRLLVGNTEEVLNARYMRLVEEFYDLLIQESHDDSELFLHKREGAFLRATEIRDLTGDSLLYLIGDEDTHETYGAWCQELPLIYRNDLGAGSWFFFNTQLWRAFNMKAMVMETAKWNTPLARQLQEAAYFDPRYYTYLRTSVQKSSLNKGAREQPDGEQPDREQQRLIDYIAGILPGAITVNSQTGQREVDVARLDMSVVNTADLYAEFRERGVAASLKDRTTAQAYVNFFKNIGLVVEAFNLLSNVLEADKQKKNIQQVEHEIDELKRKVGTWENVPFREQYTAAVEAYLGRRYGIYWRSSTYDRSLVEQPNLQSAVQMRQDLSRGIAASIHHTLFLGSHIQDGARRGEKGHVYKFDALFDSPEVALDWQETAREVVFLLGGGTEYQEGSNIRRISGISQLNHFLTHHIKNDGTVESRKDETFKLEHLIAFAGLKMVRKEDGGYYFERAKADEINEQGCTLPEKVGYVDEEALKKGEHRTVPVELSGDQYKAIEGWLKRQLGGDEDSTTASSLRSVPSLDYLIVRPIHYEMARLNQARDFDEVREALNLSHSMRLGLRPGIRFSLDEKEKGVLIVQDPATGQYRNIMHINESLTFAALDPYWAAAAGDGFNIRKDPNGHYIVPPPILHPKDRKLFLLETIMFHSEWWLKSARSLATIDNTYLADTRVVWRKIIKRIYSDGKLSDDEYSWLCERLPFLKYQIGNIPEPVFNRDHWYRMVRSQLDIAYEGALPSQVMEQKVDRIMEGLKGIPFLGGIFKVLDMVPGRVMPKNLSEFAMKVLYAGPTVYAMMRVFGGMAIDFGKYAVNEGAVEILKTTLPAISWLVDIGVDIVHFLPKIIIETGNLNGWQIAGIAAIAFIVWKAINDDTSVVLEERKRIDKWGTIGVLGFSSIPIIGWLPPNICTFFRWLAKRKGIHDYYGDPIQKRADDIEKQLLMVDQLDIPQKQ